MITGYTVLDQYDEARKYALKAGQLGLNCTDMLSNLMTVDGVTGDMAGIQKILAGAGRPDQFLVTGQWASVQAQWGQFRAAVVTLQQAAGQAAAVKAPDAQAGFVLTAAFIGWPVGECQNAEASVRQALAVDKSKPTQIAAAAAQASSIPSPPYNLLRGKGGASP